MMNGLSVRHIGHEYRLYSLLVMVQERHIDK
jgi:hypothetical protein